MKNRFYYLNGILVSQLGTGLFLVGMVLWIKEQYKAPFSIGLFLFFLSLSAVIASPFTGVIVDRLSPKRTMIVADIANGTLMLILATCMYFIEQNIIENGLNIILGLTILTSFFQALFTPSSLSLIGLVFNKDDIRNINGLSSNVTELSKLFGRSLAGLGLLIFSPKVLIFLNGLSFIISAFLESKIKLLVPYQPMNKKLTYFSDLKEGVVFLKKSRLLIALFTGASLCNFFMAMNIPILPYLLKDVLNQDLWWYGIILSSNGLGALIGGYIARKTSKENIIKMFNTALIMQGLPFAFVPLATHPAQIFALIFLVGLFYVFVQVNMLTLVTSIVPKEFRGRIFSLMFMIVGLFMPLSYLITGQIGSRLSFSASYTSLYYIAGLAIPTVWIVVLGLLKNQHGVILSRELK